MTPRWVLCSFATASPRTTESPEPSHTQRGNHREANRRTDGRTDGRTGRPLARRERRQNVHPPRCRCRCHVRACADDKNKRTDTRSTNSHTIQPVPQTKLPAPPVTALNLPNPTPLTPRTTLRGQAPLACIGQVHALHALDPKGKRTDQQTNPTFQPITSPPPRAA